MGKKQIYLEDDLYDAVVSYAEVYKGKIKATELAKWAGDNIPSLLGVRDYHFTRTVRVRDAKSGKVTEEPKRCKKEIDRINETRSAESVINGNILLKSNPEELFNLPPSDQRKIVVDARNLFWKVNAELATVRKENIFLRDTNKELLAKLTRLEKDIQTILSEQSTIKKKLSHYAKSNDEEERKKRLETIGIYDEIIDIERNIISVSNSTQEVFNIRDAILRYLDEEENTEEKSNQEDEINKMNSDAIERIFGKQ